MRCMIRRAFGPGAALAILALTLYADEPKEGPEASEKAEPPKADLALRIAVVLGAPAGTLSFSLTNRGEADFETTPIATNYNRLLITVPDGGVVEHFFWKDRIPPVLVKAGEHVTWKVEVASVLECRDLTGVGTYRLSWQVGEAKSDEMLLLRE